MALLPTLLQVGGLTVEIVGVLMLREETATLLRPVVKAAAARQRDGNLHLATNKKQAQTALRLGKYGLGLFAVGAAIQAVGILISVQ